MDLELRQLRTFLAVAAELHFSRAARRLHVSQPALSQQIRALERTLGVALFDRSSRATELTPAGRVLLDAAPRVLYEAERAQSLVTQAANGAVGLLTVGSVGTALASDHPAHPALDAGALPRPAARGQPSRTPRPSSSPSPTAASTSAWCVPRPRPRRWRSSTSSPSRCSSPCRPTTASPTGSSIVPEDLAEEPFVLWPRPLGRAFFDTIVGYCHEHGFSPRIVAEGADIETQLGLVAAGLGVSLQPSYYANLRPPGVVFLPLEGEVPQVALQVAWRRTDRSPAVAHFVEAAKECADGA